MKEEGLYSAETCEITHRVEQEGMLNLYAEKQ